MNQLRKLREELNLKQSDVAKALHISRQSYNFYENQQRDPKPEMLIQMADFFKVSIDYLLGRDESEPSNDTIPAAEENSLLKKISTADAETQAELAEYLNYLESKKGNKKKTAETPTA